MIFVYQTALVGNIVDCTLIANEAVDYRTRQTENSVQVDLCKGVQASEFALPQSNLVKVSLKWSK